MFVNTVLYTIIHPSLERVPLPRSGFLNGCRFPVPNLRSQIFPAKIFKSTTLSDAPQGPPKRFVIRRNRSSRRSLKKPFHGASAGCKRRSPSVPNSMKEEQMNKALINMATQDRRGTAVCRTIAVSSSVFWQNTDFRYRFMKRRCC